MENTLTHVLSPASILLGTVFVVCAMWLPYALVMERVVAALTRR